MAGSGGGHSMGGHSSGGHSMGGGRRSYGGGGGRFGGRGGFSGGSFGGYNRRSSGGGSGILPWLLLAGGSRRRFSGGGNRNGGCGGCLGTVLIVILLLLMFASTLDSCSCSRRNDHEPKPQAVQEIHSDRIREKLNSGNAYINDCIIDELGWFTNRNRASADLQTYWKKTGVQPFIYLREYDSSLTTDDEMIRWAENYYDSHFKTDNIFLVVYFADNSLRGLDGYMTYVNGSDSSTVMDAEAVEIFWNYLDMYWDDPDMNDAGNIFSQTFTKTAETIMNSRENRWFSVAWKLAIAALLAAAVAIFAYTSVQKKKNKNGDIIDSTAYEAADHNGGE